MSDDFPSIQGEYHSWAEIAIPLEIFGGKSFKTPDIAGIKWDETADPEDVPGIGPDPVGRTVGSVKRSGELSMWNASALEFMKELAKKNRRIRLVKFDIPGKWEALDGEGVIHTFKLVGCRIAGRTFEATAGDAAPSKVVFPLSIARIELDGTIL